MNLKVSSTYHQKLKSNEIKKIQQNEKLKNDVFGQLKQQVEEKQKLRLLDQKLKEREDSFARSQFIAEDTKLIYDYQDKKNKIDAYKNILDKQIHYNNKIRESNDQIAEKRSVLNNSPINSKYALKSPIVHQNQIQTQINLVTPLHHQIQKPFPTTLQSVAMNSLSFFK